MQRSKIIGAFVFASTLGALAALAGPLDPPAGPVGSTGKTLTEVEPRVALSQANTPGDSDCVFRITSPGSYYLTGGMIVPSGFSGIEIAASGVSIDLMGFTVKGEPGSLDGIVTVSIDPQSISVRYGAIEGCGGDGLDFGSPNTAQNCIITEVRASGNGQNGFVTGINASITQCVARNNGAAGFSAGASSSLRGCSAESNGQWGVISGLAITMSDCTAYLNGDDGFNLAGGGAVSNCTSYENAGDGFDVGGTVVTNCQAHLNGANGFFLRIGCTLSRSSATYNGSHGAESEGRSFIEGNIMTNNGVLISDGAGVHVSGGDNRVDGNNCSQNDNGVAASGMGSVIIRNTCSGNGSNFFISGGNRYGPIINITTPTGPAASGNSAPSQMASTDPWANFAY